MFKYFINMLRGLVMFEYQLNMAETVGFAIILLLLGRWIKKKVNFFERFFIPAPVIGGTLFSIILLIGHQTESFTFTFNNDIKNLLMIAFFTTVGFSASLKNSCKRWSRSCSILISSYNISYPSRYSWTCFS